MSNCKNEDRRDQAFAECGFLKDESLSAAARGVLITALSLPKSTSVSIESLTAILPDGRTAVSSALAALEKRGYFKRECKNTENGRFRWELAFSSEPVFRTSK